MEFTSKKLLDKVLDFYCFYSLKERVFIGHKRETYFFTENLKEFQSGYYRLLEIEALFKAFGLSSKLQDETVSSLENFISGKFVYDNRENLKKHFHPIFVEYLKNYRPEVKIDNHLHYNIAIIFSSMIKTRIELHEKIGMYSFPSEGLGLESVYAGHYRLMLSEKAFNEYDNVLYSIFNPLNLSFSKQDLIENFNFPDVDLDKIDLEERLKSDDDY